MPEFTRQKKFSEKFVRIRVDERDLARLARTIQEATREYDGTIEIEVTSPDEAETIRTTDPEFLESVDMPREVGSVSIGYRNYKAPLSCKVKLSTQEEGTANLEVDGTDVHRVAGLYDDLKRQLTSLHVFGESVAKRLDSLPMHFGISAFPALAIYSLFDLALMLFSFWFPTFKGSPLNTFIARIGWLCVGAGFMMGGFPIKRLLKDALPAVEFAGKISDRKRVRRSLIYWVFSAILIPIIVRVLWNLIADLLARVR